MLTQLTCLVPKALGIAAVAAMEAYAKVQGHETDFGEGRFHHEIHLSDVRRCPEYPCSRYDGFDDGDSFVPHRNRQQDIALAREVGAGGLSGPHRLAQRSQTGEVLDEAHFVEYTKSGYATNFTVTACEPFLRWAFIMENGSMSGAW